MLVTGEWKFVIVGLVDHSVENFSLGCPCMCLESVLSPAYNVATLNPLWSLLSPN